MRRNLTNLGNSVPDLDALIAEAYRNGRYYVDHPTAIVQSSGSPNATSYLIKNLGAGVGSCDVLVKYTHEYTMLNATDVLAYFFPTLLRTRIDPTATLPATSASETPISIPGATARHIFTTGTGLPTGGTEHQTWVTPNLGLYEHPFGWIRLAPEHSISFYLSLFAGTVGGKTIEGTYNPMIHVVEVPPMSLRGL